MYPFPGLPSPFQRPGGQRSFVLFSVVMFDLRFPVLACCSSTEEAGTLEGRPTFGAMASCPAGVFCTLFPGATTAAEDYFFGML